MLKDDLLKSMKDVTAKAAEVESLSGKFVMLFDLLRYRARGQVSEIARLKYRWA